MAHGVSHASALLVTVHPPRLFRSHVGPLKALHLVYKGLLLSTVVHVKAALLGRCACWGSCSSSSQWSLCAGALPHNLFQVDALRGC
eukprot:Skav229721  [mRNA]  locus=scaffold49:323680:323940:+ [translate_table: standard]